MASLLRSRVVSKSTYFKELLKVNINLKHLKNEYHIATFSNRINKSKLHITRPCAFNQAIRLQSTLGLGQHALPATGVSQHEINPAPPISSFETVSQPSANIIEPVNETINHDLIYNNGVQAGENTFLHTEASIIDAQPVKPPEIEFIPEPPPIPNQTLAEGIEINDIPVENLQEIVTLASQGLGGWSPSGLVQEALNFLHFSCDLPWYGAILLGTLTVRLLLFPVVIKAQKIAAEMSTVMPQVQLLQSKMTEARRSGNPYESAKYSQEMMEFMKKNNFNPFKGLIMPLVQAPIFFSVYFGIRGMANLPMEGFKDGGIGWFIDLTVPDPLYLLPILTSATLLATIEMGTDGVKASNMQNARYILRAMPFIIFPFMINFPSAMLCYWCANNAFSLIQVSILKIPAVREYFKIPKVVPPPPEKVKPKKGFVEGFKESMANMKITRELDDRARLDEIRFRKSGMGPIPKTYSYDPTKQNNKNTTATSSSKTSVYAKKSDR